MGSRCIRPRSTSNTRIDANCLSCRPIARRILSGTLTARAGETAGAFTMMRLMGIARYRIAAIRAPTPETMENTVSGMEAYNRVSLLAEVPTVGFDAPDVNEQVQ